MWVYVFAVGAALLFAVGSVVQQRVAFDAPPGKSLRLSLLLWCFRQPVWLIGVLTAALGNGLSAAALAAGSVALVQPLLVVRLVFAVPLSAVWARQGLVARDWLGIFAVAGGLAAFIALGRPQQETGSGTAFLPWVITASVIVAGVLLLLTVVRRLRPQLQAPLLGAGAGVLYGTQSGLMHVVVHQLGTSGIAMVLINPMTYGIVLCSVIGTVFTQSAYEMAPLAASYPTLAAIEPLAGIGIGLGVLGGALSFGALPVAVEVAGLAVMTVGIFLLATSQLVSSSKEEMWWRMIEERTADLERDLAHRIRSVRHHLEHAEGSAATDPHRGALVQRVAAELGEARDCGLRLSRLNEDVLEEAEQRKAAATTGRVREHDRLMAKYAGQLCDREEALRGDLDELGRRHQRLTA
ncbi:MAG TPA: DMT family transporter [Marmoricola sp.]|nr:DMT family transporter [Marmoricola sp.]